MKRRPASIIAGVCVSSLLLAPTAFGVQPSYTDNDLDSNWVSKYAANSNDQSSYNASDNYAYPLYGPPPSREVNPGEPVAFELSFTTLNRTVAEAETIDRKAYTPESIEALDKALKKAKEASNTKLLDVYNKTEYETAQSQIDEATINLMDAISDLEERTFINDHLLEIQIAAVVGIVLIIAVPAGLMLSKKRK